MAKANKENVCHFLKLFKQSASTEGIYVVPRRKNMDALLKLDLTEANREEIILNLSVNDYCKGPSKDTDQGGDVWEFGKEVGERTIYLKLKIFMIDKKIQAKCISFHEAEYPMSWPFKK